MTDTVTFSLYNSADINRRYLPRPSDDAIKVFGESGEFGQAPASYMIAFSQSCHDGTVDPGPVWEITKAEYQQCWFDVRDDRIVSYLMLGLPGWTASIAHEMLGKVPSPNMVYDLFHMAEKIEYRYVDLATVISDVIHICKVRHGRRYSAPDIVTDLKMMMREDHLKEVLHQNPQGFARVVATCLVARARFSSTRPIQMSVDMALSARSDLEVLGYTPDDMDQDDLHDYLSLCCTPQGIDGVFVIKGLEAGSIRSIAALIQAGSEGSLPRDARGMASRDIFRVAQLMTEGIPLEWAISSILGGQVG